MNDKKELEKYIEEYGSIPDGYHVVDETNEKKSKKVSYEDIQARRDNMTNVGNLDYEI